MLSLPGQAVGFTDNAIWHGKDARACFEELGSMRVNITIDLWNRLGLRRKFPDGWLLPDQSLPAINLMPPAFDNKVVGRQIFARTILPKTIQCTCDATGNVVKQSAQEWGQAKIPSQQAAHLFDNTMFKETSDQSSEIFASLQELCQQRKILGVDGLRITWGITTEGNVLTPVGGFGLPDHARYFLADRGPGHILDRRFAKREWTSNTEPQDARALSRRIPMMTRELENRYTLCHSALMAH